MPKWCWVPRKRFFTIKRALKFGSTLHICIGFVFWYFLVILLPTINITNSTESTTTNTKVSIDNNEATTESNTKIPISAWMGIQYFIYLFLFLPLGIFLHRGVKKESVPVLQSSGIGFLILQLYGGLTQYLHGLVLSSFITTTFPSIKIQYEILLEIGIGLILTIIYLILICLFVRKLRSRFYIPPVYPYRVEFFYYPDTSSNITVFQKQVPCTIMHNYQNSAYFVQKDLIEAGTSTAAAARRSSGTTIPNGRIPSVRNFCKPW